MIRCPKCKSLGKVVDLNFAKLKREGEPSDKSELLDKEGYCPVCGHDWILDSGAYDFYNEYVVLRNEVAQMVVVYDHGKGLPYNPKPMDVDKLIRMKELAKLLSDEHRHNLDVAAGEWFEIIRDAS